VAIPGSYNSWTRMAPPAIGTIVTSSTRGLSKAASTNSIANARKVIALPRPSAFSIGVDILHIPRLRNLLYRRNSYNKRFARRILSESEFKDYIKLFHEVTKKSTGQTKQGEEAESDKLIRWLGVRWAAKEACYKACSSYDPKPVWKGVTLMKEVTGKIDHLLNPSTTAYSFFFQSRNSASISPRTEETQVRGPSQKPVFKR
jgi:phosphopantetheine--protein transferase-like protein